MTVISRKKDGEQIFQAGAIRELAFRKLFPRGAKGQIPLRRAVQPTYSLMPVIDLNPPLLENATSPIGNHFLKGFLKILGVQISHIPQGIRTENASIPFP
jgi:hypothetical protein